MTVPGMPQGNKETVEVCRQIDAMLKQGAAELSNLHSGELSQ